MTRVGSTFVSGERSPPELIGWPASEHGWLGVSVLRLNGTISSRYLAPLQRPVCDLNPCELRRCANRAANDAHKRSKKAPFSSWKLRHFIRAFTGADREESAGADGGGGERWLFPTVHKTGRPGRVMTGDAVAMMIQRRAAAAGYTAAQVDLLGGHSLRSGFVTEAFRAGADAHSIMGRPGTAIRRCSRCTPGSSSPSSATPS